MEQVYTPTIATDIDTFKSVVAAKLDKLARWEQEQRDIEAIIEQQKIATLAPIQEQIDALMAPYKKRLEELEADKQANLSLLVPGIDRLRTEIQQDALAAGAVAKDHKFCASGQELMVIYYDGRETADIKGLKGLAKLIPAIMEFIKKGDPYTSIQKSRKKNGGDE